MCIFLYILDLQQVAKWRYKKIATDKVTKQGNRHEIPSILAITVALLMYI